MYQSPEKTSLYQDGVDKRLNALSSSRYVGNRTIYPHSNSENKISEEPPPSLRLIFHKLFAGRKKEFETIIKEIMKAADGCHRPYFVHLVSIDHSVTLAKVRGKTIIYNPNMMWENKYVGPFTGASLFNAFSFNLKYNVLCVNIAVYMSNFHKGNFNKIRPELFEDAEEWLCEHYITVINNFWHRKTEILFIACIGGHLGIVKLLLEKGANVNQADNGGGTPLIAAQQEKHPKIVEFLKSWIKRQKTTAK